MGRMLKITKHANARWGKDAESIAQSFVTNSLLKKVKYASSNTVAFEKISYSSLGLGSGYKVGSTKFVRVGNEFGCREGLTRDMQNQSRQLGKNSYIIVRNKMPIQQVTYREMFNKDWKNFLKDFFSHVGMNDVLVDMAGIYSEANSKIAFPVDGSQSLTMGTLASSLILLARNPVIFCRDRGRKGLRNYREVIEELVRDKLNVAKKRNRGLNATQIYSRNSSNFILWNLLYYFDLMPDVSKGWRFNSPNGPDTYVAYGSRKIGNTIKKLDKEQRENLFDILGGKDSPVIRSFPSSVSVAIQDMATAK
jgi:hypothetical protein